MNKWNYVGYLRKGQSFEYEYNLWLPQPLASWDVWDYWEHQRVHSMQAHLKRGDVLFDIGAEMGWLSAVYAKIVGGDNMVLIEPTPEFWPNIRAIWNKNIGQNVYPMYCFQGLMDLRGDKDFEKSTDIWPPESQGDLIDKNKYQYIHDHQADIKSTSIDQFVQHTNIVPDALTIDVEGAELRVLKGGKKTIARYSPKIWVSVHPDLMERDYKTKVNEFFEYMTEIGYVGTHLATDHEMHYLYRRGE